MSLIGLNLHCDLFDGRSADGIVARSPDVLRERDREDRGAKLTITISERVSRVCNK